MSKTSFFRSGLIVAAGILLGRLSGFYRDILLAKGFGATAVADGIMVILTLPDLLTGLFVGGALAAVMIPELQTAPSEKRSGIFWRTSLASAAVFGVLALLLYLGIEQVLGVLAPGIAPEILAENRTAFGVSLVAFPLAVLAAVTTAYLQSRQKFLAAAFGTLIVNMAVVVAIFIGGEVSPLMLLAYAILAGAALRWLVQIAAALRLPKADSESADVMTGTDPLETAAPVSRTGVWRRYGEALAAGSILLLLPVAARSFASLNEAGSLAVFNYSLKLVEFPLNAVLTVFSTVLFPYFAKFFSRPDVADQSKMEVSEVLRRSMMWVLFLGASATSVLLSLAFLLRTANVGYGALQPEDLRLIGLVSLVMSLGLLPRAYSSLHVMLFNSRKETWVPLVLNVVGIAIFFGLIFPFQKSMGLLGVAWSLTTVFWLISIAEVILLSRRYRLPMVSFLASKGALKLGSLFAAVTLAQWMIQKVFGEYQLGLLIQFIAMILLGTLATLVGLFSFDEGREFWETKIMRRKKT